MLSLPNDQTKNNHLRFSPVSWHFYLCCDNRLVALQRPATIWRIRWFRRTNGNAFTFCPLGRYHQLARARSPNSPLLKRYEKRIFSTSNRHFCFSFSVHFNRLHHSNSFLTKPDLAVKLNQYENCSFEYCCHLYLCLVGTCNHRGIFAKCGKRPTTSQSPRHLGRNDSFPGRTQRLRQIIRVGLLASVSAGKNQHLG